jgi:hypothetical protein
MVTPPHAVWAVRSQPGRCEWVAHVALGAVRSAPLVRGGARWYAVVRVQLAAAEIRHCVESGSRYNMTRNGGSIDGCTWSTVREHRLVEAMKFAYAERTRIADPCCEAGGVASHCLAPHQSDHSPHQSDHSQPHSIWRLQSSHVILSKLIQFTFRVRLCARLRHSFFFVMRFGAGLVCAEHVPF